MTYDPSSGDPTQAWQEGTPPPQHATPGAYQQPAGWGTMPGYGGPGTPPLPGYPAPGGTTGGQPEGGSDFFRALFDFGFHNFITPFAIKVLYVLGTIVIGLFFLAAVISGFGQGIGLGLLFLVGGVLVAFFYLIFLRITLEFYYAIVRMSEDIHHRR